LLLRSRGKERKKNPSSFLVGVLLPQRGEVTKGMAEKKKASTSSCIAE